MGIEITKIQPDYSFSRLIENRDIEPATVAVLQAVPQMMVETGGKSGGMFEKLAGYFDGMKDQLGTLVKISSDLHRSEVKEAFMPVFRDAQFKIGKPKDKDSVSNNMELTLTSIGRLIESRYLFFLKGKFKEHAVKIPFKPASNELIPIWKRSG